MADNNLEYALRRKSDGAYLWDDDLDGRYISWEDDEDNATWLGYEQALLELAEMDGLADEGEDGPVLKPEYEMVSRQWRFEEEYGEDD